MSIPRFDHAYRITCISHFCLYLPKTWPWTVALSGTSFEESGVASKGFMAGGSQLSPVQYWLTSEQNTPFMSMSFSHLVFSSIIILQYSPMELQWAVQTVSEMILRNAIFISPGAKHQEPHLSLLNCPKNDPLPTIPK